MGLIDFILKKIKLSEEKSKVVKNIYWATLGKVISLLGGLLVGIFVARYLGPKNYGLMNYVISYVSLFQVFATFGLDNIEIREESKKSLCVGDILGTSFILKISFAVVTILLIAITTYFNSNDGYTRLMIFIYSFSIILNSSNVIRNFFTSLVWNEYIVKTEIYRSILGAGIKILLLLLKAPLSAFIIACLLDVLILALGYFSSYKKHIGNFKDWRFNKSIALYLIKESFPLLLSGTAVVIYQRIDQVMIGDMIDNASVGYFSVASKFVEVIIFIPNIMAQTITPILIRRFKEDYTNYLAYAQKFMDITVWLSIIMAVFISCIANPLIKFTYGNQYLSSVIILQIMSYKVVGMALSSCAGQMIILEGNQKYAFIRNVMGCILCVVLNLLFIPKWGIIGSSVVTVITTLFTGVLANVFIPPYWKYLRCQIKALLFGWRELLRIKSFLHYQ